MEIDFQSLYDRHTSSPDYVSIDSGIDTLSVTDIKDGNEKIQSISDFGEISHSSLSPSKLRGDSTAWRFSGGSFYDDKERYIKKDRSNQHSNSLKGKKKDWRRFRMHEGVALPLEEFRMAVMQGNLHVVKSLLSQGIAVDQILKSGWTALMFASSCGKFELTRYLLNQGADPNMHKEMFTALMAACASSRENEESLLNCVNLLLEFGAKVNACERHCMTALMFASKEGRTAIVERLIEAKADINMQDNKGWTTLCWAATKGHGIVVRKLLEASADPAKVNVHGQRSSDIAMAAGYTQLADVLERAATKGVSVDLSSLSKEKALIPKSNDNLETSQAQCGEMEMLLRGLDLPDLIPLFQKNKVTLECFLRLTENDLEKIGVGAMGTRKKLLEAIAHIHKQEWKTTSLPNLTGLPHITLPDAVSMVENINRHLRFIHASVGHLRDQIQATPRILQLGQEKHNVSVLSKSFSVSLTNLSHLTDEVKFFKAHLEKVCNDAEYAPADTVVTRRDDGRQWQRSLLASLVVTTSVVSAVYFLKPTIFSWLFSLSAYPQRSVFVDIT